MSSKQVSFVNLGIQFENLEKEIVTEFTRLSRRGQYILGEDVELFEQEFSKYCQCKYSLGVANGSDALFLPMKALGIGEGDEVITAPNSFIASAWTIVATGARPVFSDVGEDYNLDPNKLEKAITPKTKAIMPVHLTGLPADMGPIQAIAKKHNLFIIEDCAQAIGAEYENQRVGAIGTAGGFSLHPLKNLHVHGDGGVITTNDNALYEKMKLLRNHGLKNRDECVMWGYNSRLDTIQAAIARVKMKYLDQWTTRYRQIANYYWEGLKNTVEVPQRYQNRIGVYHNFVVQVDGRADLMSSLAKRGVETKIHYPIPLHLQKAAENLKYKRGDFPVTERQSERIMSLPIYPELTDSEIEYVVKTIKELR